MSSLASPDEVPFVFGAYATHLTEVSAVHRLEDDALVAPRSSEPDQDLAAVLSTLPIVPARR